MEYNIRMIECRGTTHISVSLSPSICTFLAPNKRLPFCGPLARMPYPRSQDHTIIRIVLKNMALVNMDISGVICNVELLMIHFFWLCVDILPKIFEVECPNPSDCRLRGNVSSNLLHDLANSLGKRKSQPACGADHYHAARRRVGGRDRH